MIYKFNYMWVSIKPLIKMWSTVKSMADPCNITAGLVQENIYLLFGGPKSSKTRSNCTITWSIVFCLVHKEFNVLHPSYSIFLYYQSTTLLSEKEIKLVWLTLFLVNSGQLQVISVLSFKGTQIIKENPSSPFSFFLMF